MDQQSSSSPSSSPENMPGAGKVPETPRKERALRKTQPKKRKVDKPLTDAQIQMKKATSSQTRAKHGVYPPRVSRAALEESLRRNFGLVSNAARQLGISNKAIYFRISHDKTGRLKQVLDEAREHLIDSAEFSLRQRIVAGDGWAVMFTLKTLGKHRGYRETTGIEISGPDGMPVQCDLNLTVQALITKLAMDDEYQDFARQRAARLAAAGNGQPTERRLRIVGPDAGVHGDDRLARPVATSTAPGGPGSGGDKVCIIEPVDSPRSA